MHTEFYNQIRNLHRNIAGARQYYSSTLTVVIMIDNEKRILFSAEYYTWYADLFRSLYRIVEGTKPTTKLELVSAY